MAAPHLHKPQRRWHRVTRRPYLRWPAWWDWRRRWWEKYFWQRVDQRIHDALTEHHQAHHRESHRHDPG